MEALRRIAVWTAAGAGLLALSAVALWRLDRAFPPPLPASLTVSTEVQDRDGQLLRAFATPDGYWRLATSLDQVDRQFVDMLATYEDKRFWDHKGVDVLALARAAGQFVTSGHIVSGGSTLSMQLARLIEPRDSRSIGSKIKQMLRAIQIERRLSKREILERYLTLAPYGGNLEGVRAASLAYFGKEPKRLTVSEAALLVALPQLPEKRRPDRNLQVAHAARDRVLTRMISAGLLGEREAARAALDDVSSLRRTLPAFAAHAAYAMLPKAVPGQPLRLTIRKSVQEGLEQVAKDAAAKLGPRLSVAMVLADARTGDILGEVGSADFFDASRSGWIDMTRVVRSPGSTLKPFIYGLAFEQGLVAQETLIEDSPADFSGYRPKNFDMGYQGDVSIRQALQLSLNVPAIRVLDAVGPARLTARFRRAGVMPVLPVNEAPGLAIGLGGVGVTLRDLVQLYTGLANGGKAHTLHDGTEPANTERSTATILDDQANWQVTDILSGVKPPEGAAQRGIAYKTGTSYGYRDAWSVGFDGRYVLGVWVGRPDAGAVPGLSGYVSAAPILFDGFVRSGLAAVPLPGKPAGVIRPKRDELPVTLARFGAGTDGLVQATPTEPAPTIIFPPDGARVDLDTNSADASPLVLKLQGGRAPFRWLANGKPLVGIDRRRTATWQPDGAGYSTLTVIDAAGRAASVKVFVE
ncbi:MULTISPECIES: penicillin-binding protein 1C [unclassified Mesorhizobium]|uniref:penicillin-binding protein 1C n=1 Tax=unclassified Mesorhizobium TaxID=325217 RepID=UPI000FD942E9|nr:MULTISPECIES: penicillin-binding protein 1C [unclassified Mesorhizobium]TGQ42582.1 penicillin-binding protein 1C [Mesorhizobium sp. M00.F.Ca.ET.216.01.1.1]TIS55418.1 MAG: penicillin-binding protein 1C [Mesorhizobium sp.]TIS89972.1 MAG: penicillin-binding protein 1C [Mesorhizobium sp.]TJW09586.1 MAG: penicillin-binding protein 1C [Mesorhizobium sp.]TJW49026.1 MAG: penicillin-binding protein 1C [Mesorhizobium sp.]